MTRKFNPRSPKRSLSQQDASENTSIPPLGSSPQGLHPSPYRASPSRRALGHPPPHVHVTPNASSTPPSAYIYRPPSFGSVHQRNLHLASRPLVFVFDAFGVAIYEVMLIFGIMWILYFLFLCHHFGFVYQSSYFRFSGRFCSSSGDLLVLTGGTVRRNAEVSQL